MDSNLESALVPAASGSGHVTADIVQARVRHITNKDEPNFSEVVLSVAVFEDEFLFGFFFISSSW